MAVLRASNAFFLHLEKKALKTRRKTRASYFCLNDGESWKISCQQNLYLAKEPPRRTVSKIVAKHYIFNSREQRFFRYKNLARYTRWISNVTFRRDFPFCVTITKTEETLRDMAYLFTRW